MDIVQALLQAIHEQPTDPTSWLVLADWLEEHDAPDRAEFVRLHWNLRSLPEGAERRQQEERLQKMLRAGVRPCTPTLVNSIGMELALICPGSFWLGSPREELGRYEDEGPRRLIHITRPAYLGVYPVTQEEYRRVMGVNPSAHAPGGRLADHVVGLDTRRFPVEEVTWNDATLFCRTLASLPAERLAGRVYRLPTEAEWEYACRGGAALLFPFPWGRTITNDLCNFHDVGRRKAKKKNLGRVSTVGSYLPNGFGLHDMVGNTWEWCADWYGSGTYASNPPADPPGPIDGERRNARGGTFHLERRRVRSADRSAFVPTYHNSDCGLRVLCEWKVGIRSAAEGEPV